MFTPGKKGSGKMPEIIDMRRGGKEKPKLSFESSDYFGSQNIKKETMEESTGREGLVDVMKEFETLNFDEQFRPKTQEGQKIYEMLGERLTEQQYDANMKKIQNFREYLLERELIIKKHNRKFILYHNKEVIHSGAELKDALLENLKEPGAFLCLVGREGQELVESGSMEMEKIVRTTAEQLQKEGRFDEAIGRMK